MQKNYTTGAMSPHMHNACHHLAAECRSGERKHRVAAQVNGIVSHTPET